MPRCREHGNSDQPVLLTNSLVESDKLYANAFERVENEADHNGRRLGSRRDIGAPEAINIAAGIDDPHRPARSVPILRELCRDLLDCCGSIRHLHPVRLTSPLTASRLISEKVLRAGVSATPEPSCQPPPEPEAYCFPHTAVCPASQLARKVTLGYVANSRISDETSDCWS